MKYEYKYRTIELTEDQLQVVELGMVKPETANALVLELINEEGADGWEAMYPFSFPDVWFKRQTRTRKTKETS